MRSTIGIRWSIMQYELLLCFDVFSLPLVQLIKIQLLHSTSTIWEKEPDWEYQMMSSSTTAALSHTFISFSSLLTDKARKNVISGGRFMRKELFCLHIIDVIAAHGHLFLTRRIEPQAPTKPWKPILVLNFTETHENSERSSVWQAQQWSLNTQLAPKIDSRQLIGFREFGRRRRWRIVQWWKHSCLFVVRTDKGKKKKTLGRKK